MEIASEFISTYRRKFCVPTSLECNKTVGVMHASCVFLKGTSYRAGNDFARNGPVDFQPSLITIIQRPDAAVNHGFILLNDIRQPSFILG
ncbi:hypothetical protein Pan54_05870 [Rubinisphaera italica]|uniref:Uncharacterized protein n=1 Tax=Rubinisphaera italica TaxID=2527969 RepID=A0A5C5XA37_9PLAN|nr:hypothetical protein Pan54_05870 [Rubinisphaera italica]